MSKKTESADVDDLLGDDGAEAETKPAKKAKKAKPAAAAPAKKAKGKAAAKAAPAKKAKKEAAEEKPAADSPLRKALLKVKKAISYADFAEANDFNIRTVRRTARAMRDAGEIELSKDGQTVYISAAV